jgi:hypothetical protein
MLLQRPDDVFGSNASVATPPASWQVLVFDPEGALHGAVVQAVQGETFFGQPVEVLHARDQDACFDHFKKSEDIAVAFFPMAPESSHAGFDVVQYVRRVLRKHTARLVVSVVDAACAPDVESLSEYDIDDCLDSSRMSAAHIRAVIQGRLRAYRGLLSFDSHRSSLERVLESIASNQKSSSVDELSERALFQLQRLFGVESPQLFLVSKPLIFDDDGIPKRWLRSNDLRPSVVYSSLGTDTPVADLVLDQVGLAFEAELSMDFQVGYAAYNGLAGGIGASMLYVQHGGKLNDWMRSLLEVFAQSLAVTFEKVISQDSLRNHQKELVYLLRRAVEQRSRETGAHVQRVSQCSAHLAKLAGLPEEIVTLIGLSSPLHDVGKLAIPDNILNKPEALTAEEWVVMRTHATHGRDILMESRNPVMQMAARIAYSHHEKWNGSGYPLGLRGKHIPIEGRITALVDVFDALGSRRIYKAAWSREAVESELLKGKGEHFDPALVDLFLANLPDFEAICAALPDEE